MAKDRAKIMLITFHPHRTGSPHRLGDVVKTHTSLLQKPALVCWYREQILDRFLGAWRAAR
jgi:hypothetical protein